LSRLLLFAFIKLWLHWSDISHSRPALRRLAELKLSEMLSAKSSLKG
jgi:hypothetical protein